MGRTDNQAMARKTTNRGTGPLGLSHEATFIGWQEGPCASIEELIDQIGPQHLCVLRRHRLDSPLAQPPRGHRPGKSLVMYYGTSVAKAGTLVAGDTRSMGIGHQGYFGPGIYLAGDAYTAMRVAESANNREGHYGVNAFEEPPVPLHLFQVTVETGRVCQVKEHIQAIRQWAFERYGLSESEEVLKVLGEYVIEHGYDTAVVADEAGPGQDYWIVGQRWRIALMEEVVLLPKQNWIGRRTHPVHSGDRVAVLLERARIDDSTFAPIVLSPLELAQVQDWREQLIRAKDPSKLEKQFKAELFSLLASRLPQTAADFAQHFLSVETLHVPMPKHAGIGPDKLAGFFERLHERGEWQAEIVPRVAEVVLFKPEKYADLSQALYWAVRQFARRYGWA